MKILFLGDIREGHTSRMRMDALRRLGHHVEGVDTVSPWTRAPWLVRQLSTRTETGLIIRHINSTAISASRLFKPRLVWCEKQEYLSPETIAELKKDGAFVTHYTPDPYFSLDWKQTRHMNAAMCHFDALFYCKAYEEAEYRALDLPVYFLPLGYCDQTHVPSPASNSHKATFGFIGGWEPRRQRLLSELAAFSPPEIWGVYWDIALSPGYDLRKHLILKRLAGKAHFSFGGDERLVECVRGGEMYGHAYAQTLSSTAVGIGFLRDICDDQHTTRSFEIPACRSMLFADRTPEHSALFEEGVEADFFASPEEFIDKCRFYERSPSTVARIAEAGYRRTRSSGYRYIDRLVHALEFLSKNHGVE